MVSLYHHGNWGKKCSSSTSSPQLTSQDKTPAVISRAMTKHHLEGAAPESYELVQVISEEKGVYVLVPISTTASEDIMWSSVKSEFPWPCRLNAHAIPHSPSALSSELVIPDNGNVFYAMSTSANFDFLLRPRGAACKPVRPHRRCSSAIAQAELPNSLQQRQSKVSLWPLTSRVRKGPRRQQNQGWSRQRCQGTVRVDMCACNGPDWLVQGDIASFFFRDHKTGKLLSSQYFHSYWHLVYGDSEDDPHSVIRLITEDRKESAHRCEACDEPCMFWFWLALTMCPLCSDW